MTPPANLPKIILLSGPPRSGKDTAGDILFDALGYAREKFSWPLKHAIAGLLHKSFNELEAHKEEPMLDLGLPSFRRLQIDLSERWAKTFYGDDVFARLLVARMAPRSHYVITDCGFQIEVDTLAKEVGPQNCLLVQIDAQHCSYARDSRSRVVPPKGMAEWHIWNAKLSHESLRHDLLQMLHQLYQL